MSEEPKFVYRGRKKASVKSIKKIRRMRGIGDTGEDRTPLGNRMEEERVQKVGDKWRAVVAVGGATYRSGLFSTKQLALDARPALVSAAIGKSGALRP